jgi:type I restriction enzyme M protein
LPGGVFQPYTGVKTSILIFRKHTRRDHKQTFKGQRPQTQQVWFYEIEADGYTLDAKRNARPLSDNDLWDALEKFKAWRQSREIDANSYFQPTLSTERWRQVALRDSEDKLTPFGRAFGGDKTLESFAGDVWAMHELFPELPADPQQAETKTRAFQDEISSLLNDYILRWVVTQWNDPNFDPEMGLDLEHWKRITKVPIGDFTRFCYESYSFFEMDDSPALALWKSVTLEILKQTESRVLDQFIKSHKKALWGIPKPPDMKQILRLKIKSLAREIAKLDGFNVVLRSVISDQIKTIKSPKNWLVPVRAWLQNDRWQSAEGALQGSHDAEGRVRPEYIQAMEAEGLYDAKGNLKDDLLGPDCIEARDWNLSAGQYKPFDFTQLKSEKSVSELIGELRSAEQTILQGLDKLLAMVEGKE